MKKWTTPSIDELDLKYTSCGSAEDGTSGEGVKQKEYWNCVAVSDDGTVYWQGTESQEGFHKGWLGQWGN